MPDITMCKDDECPAKKHCRRYTAKPSDMQSWFAESPRKDDSCGLFWGNQADLCFNMLMRIMNGES